jgi:PAS domain S-box-containing protein
VLGKLPKWTEQIGESVFRLHRLNIGPRLTLCFLLIILALLAGNAVSLWQFQLARGQGERLSGVDQELIAVLQADTSLRSFYERLDVLADSESTGQLVSEVEALRNALLQDSRRSREALSRLPAGVQLDPTLVPTLLSIQDSLPAELEAITALAKAKEWQAVRLRLANQVRPLESRSSALVESIDREVGEERAQAVLNIGRAQRRILLTLPITAVMTLLFAAFLGSAITRSITQPLGRLMEGSTALAKGDFSHRVPAAGNDEIGRLGGVFNDMIVRLQGLYRELQKRETYLAEAQKLSHTGSFGWDISSGEIYWSPETFRIFGYEPSAHPRIELAVQRTHPEDMADVQQLIERVTRERTEFDFEHRLLMPDGSIKYLRVVGRPSADEEGRFEFVGAVTDITDRKFADEALRRSESYLAEAQGIAKTGSFVWQVEGREAVHLSDQWYRIYGFDPAQGMPGWGQRLQRVHPADRMIWHETIDGAIREKSDYEVEYRIVLPDGTLKWIYTVGHPVLNVHGDLAQFVGTSTDITERKRADEALRRSEAYLAEGQRMSRSGSWAWNVRTGELFWSQEIFRIYELDSAINPEWSIFLDRIHPDDRVAVEQRAKMESSKKDWVSSEADFRIVLPGGKIKHLRTIAHPVLDELGELTEIIGTVMDVTQQHEARAALETAFEEIKALRDQLYKENIALREEIDRSSMFEEIVGESPALQTVLAHVVKVAPTESTVLITGETGTGKELIARAIHKRSQRATRAFVSVNCAAIPQSLIASELFGHERGAFTGAMQRRLGRFEVAEGGTIFLDEIGELPLETQIALLRVLQEREFERVGSAKVIHADVRVITATNRDLQRSIDAGTFRSDLYYRLNVFPIEMPPLRKRREDIPLLVEYFIDRYAVKAGKKIRGINRATMERLKSYPWPGNIRELQNVIERSVIVCETENLTVDESWLSRSADETNPVERPLLRMPADEEKRTIEAALADARGQVSGPSGAAARLGIPPSTLDSKIKVFKINKHRFKTV